MLVGVEVGVDVDVEVGVDVGVGDGGGVVDGTTVGTSVGEVVGVSVGVEVGIGVGVGVGVGVDVDEGVGVGVANASNAAESTSCPPTRVRIEPFPLTTFNKSHGSQSATMTQYVVPASVVTATVDCSEAFASSLHARRVSDPRAPVNTVSTVS
jgi:hypothetical protein